MGHARQRAFTLLEVLVALAIFAVTALALMKIAMNNSQAQLHNQLRTKAHFVAMNVAEETKIKGEWLTGTSTEERNEQGETWQVEKKAEKTISENVQRIYVDVVHVDADTGEKYGVNSLQFFVTRPVSKSP